MKNLILITLTLCTTFINGQVPSDCISAMEVCSSNDLQIQYESPFGMYEETIGEICPFNNLFLDTETSVIWLKYKFATSGNFVFNIIPNNESTDIDFIVFESGKKDCELLNSIRCMFTGETIGAENPESCFGATGLSFNSVDFNEGPGCQKGDDNYLAPLEVNSEDEVYLLIMEFSQTGTHDYTIEHSGSAELFCDQVNVNNNNKENQIIIQPNPFISNISISNLGLHYGESSISILNLNGKEVYRNAISDNIDLGYLPSGIYFLNVEDESNHISTYKIVKN